MLRLLGIATLLLIAFCLAVSASIALAEDGATTAPTAQSPTVEAVDPDRRMIDDSLAFGEDVYEFDFPIVTGAEPNPEFNAPSDILDI
ncbi:MAG: hypothetical protein R3D05_07535 [Dongiaceae bacterium]